MDPELVSGVPPLFFLNAAVFVLAGVLPVAGGFIIDGVVHVLCGSGLRYFLTAVAASVLVGLGGYAALNYGMGLPLLPETASMGASGLGQTFLSFSIPLSLLACLLRTVRYMTKR